MICAEVGFKKSSDLGCYLGVLLLHSRVTKGTYQYLVDSVVQQLNSRNAMQLSLIGRVTLTLSILSFMSLFTMYTVALPK